MNKIEQQRISLIRQTDYIDNNVNQAKAVVDLLLSHTPDHDDIVNNGLNAVKQIMHNVHCTCRQQSDLLHCAIHGEDGADATPAKPDKNVNKKLDKKIHKPSISKP